LDATPQEISINFAGTLIADPNIEPSIVPGRYYAIMISRRGDNRTGTLVLEQGYDKVSRKTDLNKPLSISEQFDKRTTQFVQFDTFNKRFIDDINSSLWFKVFSNAVEVTNGTAYADDGVEVTLPKTETTVGGLEVSSFARDISLSTVAEGSSNYIVLSHVEEFITPGTHPRTGNFVFTQIQDSAALRSVNSSELDSLLEDTFPITLARVVDKNVRDAQAIEGTFSRPGQIDTDTIIIYQPSSELLSANLINRVISPDTECQCDNRYRIISAECTELFAGDLNDDGVLDSTDLSGLLSIVGNAINSEATERKILGGEIDLRDFLKSDLNEDDQIDGADIELLENAIDGYTNFTVSEKLQFLVLKVENVLESADFPTVFADTASTGNAEAGTANVTFTTVTENEALTIRIGDSIEIETGFNDSGTYVVASKAVDSTALGVTVTVTDANGDDVSFQGSTGFNVTIVSGTSTNMLADNQDLVDIPFESTKFSIDFIEAPHDSRFLDICDLRRNLGISFIESDSTDSCLPVSDECIAPDDCTPRYKNQQYVSGDLYLAGQLLESPGVPYHGDFEFRNIAIPLPPGSLEGCQVDIYNTFIKSDSGTSKTAAGFDAMKYSDGTLVGCEDSGSDTDISKGRVKFSQSIGSLHVDALVDGYAVDGYADETATATNVESISENFVDASFSEFSTWTADPGNSGSITSITNNSGVNTPAIFELTTSADSTVRFGRLNSPVANQNFTGDFIVEFEASRTIWPSASLVNGTVSNFATLTITNTTTTTTLKLGWREQGVLGTKIFYSGVTEETATSVVLNTFDFEIDAPDDLGDQVLFRLRRTNDVVNAFYIIPGKVDSTTGQEFGEFIRIGGNPDIQPGSGSVVMDYEISQESTPTAGLVFFTRLHQVIIQSEYVSDDVVTSLPIGRVDATSVIDRAVITLPLNLNKRTNLVSASLTLTVDGDATANDSFNVIPLDILNADNIGRLYNIPQTQNNSLITTFTPGAVLDGEEITLDVTPAYIGFLNEAGHLPGYNKGFVIEPSASADSSFAITTSVLLTLTFEDITSGVIFKVGVDIDPSTGVATINSKNILYDASIRTNRTLLNFGVYLKKAGFKNQDIELNINDLRRVGIGDCFDEEVLTEDVEECFFVTGSTAAGTLVEGPFPCNLVLS
jgi:hypothetical protein